MTIKIRKRVEWKGAGGLNAYIEYDRVNARLDFYVRDVLVLRATSSRITLPAGQQFGDGATDTVGFYGATPIAQPAATAQSSVASTAVTPAASTTITTTPSTTITSVGSTSLTALDLTRINALIDRVEELRVVAAANVGRAEEIRVAQVGQISRVEAIRVLQDQTRTDLVALGLQKGSA